MSELHVVFGAGPLGRSVVQELVRRGKTVRVVSRSGTMVEAPQGVELVPGDLYDPAAVRALAQGAAVAYQCAQPHYWEPQKFPPLQAAIIEGLTDTGTKLVIGENTYMYGDTNGTPQTEDLPYSAHTVKGKVRAGMAEASLAAHRAGKVRVAIGRGSDFFGPWALDPAFGANLFASALAGKTARMNGKLDLPHTATYLGDFGKALVLLGERDEALGQAWHVPNDRPHGEPIGQDGRGAAGRRVGRR
jgi:nucleoside-diphosphate-sugar epimerase